MNEEKIYNQFMSGEITITLDDETAQKAREYFRVDEMHAEYEFIKNALEKQIPKKPIKCCPLNDEHQMLDENEYYKCPSCGLRFRKIYVYCHYCGQRLDWSDEG